MRTTDNAIAYVLVDGQKVLHTMSYGHDSCSGIVFRDGILARHRMPKMMPRGTINHTSKFWFPEGCNCKKKNGLKGNQKKTIVSIGKIYPNS